MTASSIDLHTAASSSSASTLVSAPGKVLLAGGYLVLDPAYVGVVIATDARFYSLVERGSSSVKGEAKPEPKGKAASEGGSRSRRIVRIHSPQFVQAKWEFVITREEKQWSLGQSEESYASGSAGPNPFLSLALLYTLRLALEIKGEDALESSLADGLLVHVLGDNDFYSQRTRAQAPTSAELRALPPFNKQPCIIKDVHKTGLGSSAAMTTSLVGSLMLHLGLVGNGHTQPHSSASSNVAHHAARELGVQDLAFVHNTAQLVHCAAQGKVGSGFDVSSAVWGSHLYRRFDPHALNALMDGTKVGVEGDGAVNLRSHIQLAAALSPSNKIWQPNPLRSDASAEEPGSGTNPTAVEGLHFTSVSDLLETHRPAPLALPPFVSLILADINAGSSTPSLVSKVNAWRTAKPDWARQLFRVLASSNANLADGLLALGLEFAKDAKVYEEAVALAAGQKSRDWDATLRSRKDSPQTFEGSSSSSTPHTTSTSTSISTVLTLLIEVRNALRSIRAGMRELGTRAGAPVEPDEMGRVLRASTDGANGVLGGGVPGAGGYDALYLLYLSPPTSPSTPVPSTRSGSNREEIESLWHGWKQDGLSVGPLLCGAASDLPAAAGARQGAGVEDSSSYRWKTLQSQVELRQGDGDGNAHGDAEAVVAGTIGAQGGLRVESVDQVAGLRAALLRA